MMKGIFIFVIILSISSAVISALVDPFTFELGGDKDITEINKDFLTDDILEPIRGRSAIISGRLWTSPVPYVLDGGLDINAKGVILKAMEQFRLKTCIDFKPRDAETYYLNFQKLNGCQSFIGRQVPDGQMLSIGTNCDTVSIVEHEVLHALGFYHEQSRFDRDEFVTIITENIEEGREQNFVKVERSRSTTNGVEYDYLSVMHYGPTTFSNGNGNTVNTTDPAFQGVIGQRLDMSPRDILELNLLYSCNSTVTFQMFCGFTDGSTCDMTKCSQSELQWETVTSVSDGPTSDHTNLPSGSGGSGDGEGYFLHVSTASGQEGDSAWLETNRMSPKRDCNVQCLQFYYYHSGNEGDQLNIWIREFDDENTDTKGTARLMGQITGPATSQWKLHHVSLNATKRFQVEFEVLKGTGSSTGGFSIDDINLSDTECPHGTMQIDDLQNRLQSERFGAIIYSPRQYSPDGYAYRVAVRFFQTVLGFYFQLVSGVNDDVLVWPCPYRQVTLKMLDQNPNIQLQMSKQLSFTTDPEQVLFNGLFLWDNPRKNGSRFIDENNEVAFAGFLIGRNSFITSDDLKFREFIKGGSGIFTFSFEDINLLFDGNELPCPAVEPVTITPSDSDNDDGPCLTRMHTTTHPPPTTTQEMMYTSPPTETTEYKSWLTTTDLPPTTTSEKMYTSPPTETTEYKRMFTTTDLPPTNTTTEEMYSTILQPKEATEDSSIFCLSPTMGACPVLVFPLALMALMRLLH